MERATFIIGALLATALAGCGEGVTARPGGRVCDPGATQWCACAGGTTGVQACTDRGDGWGPCTQCGSGPTADGGAPPPSSGDGGALPAGDGTRASPDGLLAPDSFNPSGPTPISIVAAEYDRYTAQLQALGPIWPYGWVSNPVIQQGRYDREVQSITGLPPSMPKWLIYSCQSDASAKLSDAAHLQQLKQAGVYAIGLNTEGDKTCGTEFQNMTQTVVEFAALAKAKGLSSIWGPIRSRLDGTSDSDYVKMFTAGLTGIALQEQNALGPQGCVQQRMSQLKALSARLDGLAGRHVELHVQIMARQCGTAESLCGGGGGDTYGVCHDFVKQLKGVATTIGIWTIGEQDTIVPFINALRAP